MRWFDTDSRTFKILKLLEQRRGWDAKALAEKLGVSPKTVSNDIAALNDSLGDSALIEQNKGIYELYYFDLNNYKLHREALRKPGSDFEYPQMRMTYMVDMLMNSKEPCLTDEFAYRMNVSRSTVISDLKKLKEILAVYNLKIVGKPNTGLTLEGDELNLRYFVMENNYEVIYDEDVLDCDIRELFEKRIEEHGLEKVTADYLEQFMTVMLDRWLNDHPLHFRHKRFFALKDSRFFAFTDSLCDAIGERLGISIPLEERLFLTIPLAGMRTPMELDENEAQADITPETVALAQHIIEAIKMEMGLSFSFTEALEEFIYHLHFMTNRARYGFHIHNPAADEIRGKYGTSARMADIAADVILKETGLTVNIDEKGFLTAYFEVFTAEQRGADKRGYHIAVLTGSGGAVKRLLLHQLKHVLDDSVTIDMLTDHGGSLDLTGYDLFITTVQDAAKRLNTPTPVIVIDEIFNEDMLCQKIDTLRYLNKLDIPTNTGTRSVLLTLLNESRFFRFDPSVSYRDAAVKMAEKLSTEGLADSGFAERLCKRMNVSDMRFDDDIAFPHVYQTLSEHPCAAIGIYTSPATDESCPGLKLIILSGLPQKTKEDTTLIRLYDEIVMVADSKPAVNHLQTCTSYKEMLRYFITENNLFGSV